MSKNILFVSVETVKDRTAINDNIDEALMLADIKTAQDMYIEPLLGTALFNKIRDSISNTGTLTGAYKTLMDDYLTDCLVWYAIASSPETLSLRLTNKGVIRVQGDNTQLPTMTEINQLSQSYRKRAEFYCERARKYLIQNAPASFPEYLNPGPGVDDIRPVPIQNYCSIYLGNEDECRPRTYEEKYQGNRPYCC